MTFNNILLNIESYQRRCIVLLDEVYIKSAITYHGGTLFGKSLDNPERSARTVLCYMIKCLYRGPEFIAKILPVSQITADFILNQVQPIVNEINKQEDGKVIRIIADGNRTNQKHFNNLKSNGEKPWLTENNTFLLFDYVHVLKCIRNNWLTEKSGELIYEFNGNIQIAKWSVIKTLYELECNHLVKLSKLNAVAISPSPIERQKVETCLRIFCDQTVAALKSHPLIDAESCKGMIDFIMTITKFWKVCNVKAAGADVRFKDDDRGVVRSVDDPKLKFLLEVTDMAEKM